MPVRYLASLAAFCILMIATTASAQAAITAFRQAVAVAASQDDSVSSFYRDRDYRPVWTDDARQSRDRLAGFLSASDMAIVHGLPLQEYGPEALRNLAASARSARDMGRVEAELTLRYLALFRALSSGVADPASVIPAYKRETATLDAAAALRDLLRRGPEAALRDAAPQTRQYRALLREKLRLERVIEAGGWGEAATGSAGPGDSGPGVAALRDRLAALGYLDRSAAVDYGLEVTRAVRRFQADHGLAEDGVAARVTLAELNRTASARLGAVLVALERERWLRLDRRGADTRQVWVNLTDFRATIIDRGETVFETRSVIGETVPDQQTPEFSDEMDHMVINPSWYVPRSIVVNEYLPQLRRNPGAVGHLRIVDSRGRPANRARGFAQYTARNFPFSMRQPPGPRNALGRVKFMFPNKYNIYLHDTPAKSLFDREVRAFSHGCIRLNDPFEFAHALLSAQSDDPEAEFERHLRTGAERRVDLETPLPVHLVYRTAIAKAGGGMEYRRDIYGRDAIILDALRRAGTDVPDGAT